MHYDLTLNNLKIPNITGTFPFGTKVTPSDLNKGGLSTTEVNTNMMMPFANMRPKVVNEDGDTTTVEYDAKLVFSARSGTTPSAGYSVVMGQGAYVGCTVTFTNLMSYSCKVYQYDGTTTLFDIPSGNTLQAVWNGSVWVWTTSGAISAYDYRPVSSAAVHAAIWGVEDLSPQITSIHPLVTMLQLFRNGRICYLTFRVYGSGTVTSPQQLFKMPVKSMEETGLNTGSGARFTLGQNSDIIQMWDLSGTVSVDIFGHFTFIQQ